MVVHGDKLRWLMWLRVTMFLRGMRRRPATMIFTIISLLVLLGGGGLLSVGLFSAFQFLPAPENTEILYLLFSGFLFFWIILPLLSYSTNEGLDVTKLQLFPLTMLEVMFSLVFSSLFDIWTVLLFVLFGATIVAWWIHSLALGLLSILVLAVFYVVMVSISQLILALLMRTLQSRRFRDLSVIVLALLGSSCYLVSRVVSSLNVASNIGSLLSNEGFSQILRWFPSGVAASVIRDASQGDWSGSFAMLGILVLIAALALYLWQLVLGRSITASESGAARGSRQRKQRALVPVQGTIPVQAQAQAQGASPARVRTAFASAAPAASVEQSQRSQVAATGSSGGLLDQLFALVHKELLCFWRDPQLKIRAFQPLIYVAIFIIAPAVSSSGSGGDSQFYASYTPFVSAVIVFLFMLTLSQNTLGIERQSLTTLLLFPIDRRRLLWGKNLAIFLLGIVLLAILMIVCVVLAREPGMVPPAAVIGLVGMMIALGWSNFASTYFPRYQPLIGKRGYQATGGQVQGGGCLNQIMSVVMTLVTIVTVAPAALGIAIPFFLNISWLVVTVIPLSLVYGLGFYVLLTHLSARRLLATEPEILAITTRD